MLFRPVYIVIAGVFAMVLIVGACSEPAETSVVEEQPASDTVHLTIPAGFPEIDFPEDNHLTAARIALGKKLFYDNIVSENKTISCASCHLQEYAFADTARVSKGVHGRVGERNSPSLANMAYQTSFMRDGGTPTLETQLLAPIGEPAELDFNIVAIAERMAEDETYVRLSAEAYDREPNPFVVSRALAAFQRTLISGNSRYDQHVAQGLDVLTASEKNGMTIFMGDKANCSSCHSGFNFTNGELKHNGLYLNYADTGRARITFRPEDSGVYRVPSLRNVGVTAPYMHDGSIENLTDVVLHYMTGGQPHVNKSEELQPFDLTENEIQDLVAFLNALTDKEFLANNEHKP